MFSVGTNHVSVMVCHEITTVRIAADPDALAVFLHTLFLFGTLFARKNGHSID